MPLVPQEISDDCASVMGDVEIYNRRGFLRNICNGNSTTSKNGKRIQLMKMIVLVITPMAVLLGLTCYFLTGSIWDRTEMRKQKEALIYSTNLGQFIHSLQKERDQSALYLSAIGPDTKLYLLERYTETDEHLHTLSAWPADLLPDIDENTKEQFHDKFTFQIYMNNHRNSLDLFNATEYQEIQFYTENINVLIKWMYKAITLANRVGGIWKSMVAYQKLLACKENAGVERALGSVFFTRGGFEGHTYYLWYVRKLHTFQYGFHTAKTYSEVIRTMEYYDNKRSHSKNLSMIVENYRNIISNKNIFRPSLSRATQFYDNMTLYLDQLYEIQITVAQNIEVKFKEKEERSTKDIILALVIILIVLAAIPLQILSVHRQTSDIHSFALTLVDKTKELDVEKRKTDILLYQMLPKAIALQLKNRMFVDAELFDQATVMFSEIDQFARLSREYSPLQLLSLLEEMYYVFDSKAEIYDVYKVEHIVDQCLIVSGVPKRNGRKHASEIADLALDLMKSFNTLDSISIPGERISLRIGIHSGPVMAGIVGLKLPKYSLFGDTVNTAARMETNSLAKMIHISTTTYRLLKKSKNYSFICRGTITVKGKGEMLTYWLGNYDDVPHALHHRHGTQSAVMPPVTRRTLLPPPAPDVKILHSQMSKGQLKTSSMEIHRTAEFTQHPARHLEEDISASSDYDESEISVDHRIDSYESESSDDTQNDCSKSNLSSNSIIEARHNTQETNEDELFKTKDLEKAKEYHNKPLVDRHLQLPPLDEEIQRVISRLESPDYQQNSSISENSSGTTSPSSSEDQSTNSSESSC